MSAKILKDILKQKEKEVRQKKEKNNTYFFSNILSSYFKKKSRPAIIGEIKLSSPSGGILGKRKDIEKKIKDYEKSGINAISVVVDQKFFGGDISLIPKIKSITSLPVLCKDFIIDPIQIQEAKEAGAHAILLIVKIVSFKKLQELINTCSLLHIEPVVEVNSKKELDIALRTKVRCIAVNARNLVTFKVDLHKACLLGKQIPKDRIFLGFSGVHSASDVKEYTDAGAKAILIGTYLMKSKNTSEALRSLAL